MIRHDVNHTDRIRVTEEMLLQLNPSKVLEIGAGDYSFEYVQKNNSVPWVKADFSPPCDVICDFNSPDIKLPFDEGAFDLVICTEVLEHLLWPHVLLMEINRLLATKGQLMVSVPNISSLSYRIAWLMGRIPSCAASGNLPPEMGSTAYLREDGSTVGGHAIDFNLERLEKLLSSANLKILNTRGSGLIWHRQLLPHWAVPVSLSSNIICLAQKMIRSAL